MESRDKKMEIMGIGEIRRVIETEPYQ